MFTFMLRPTFDEIHKVLQCDMIVQIDKVFIHTHKLRAKSLIIINKSYFVES